MNKNIKIKVSSDGIVVGIVLILAAVLIVLEGLGMGFGAYGISLWKVVLGVLLAAWFLKELIRFKIGDIFFPLAFMFMLFEENIASLLGREDPNIISNWYVILAAILLTVGFNEVFHRVNSEKYVSVSQSHFGGASVTYIDAAELVEKNIENSFGNYVVYIENKEAYLGNGKINVDNSFGNIVIHVPEDWNVDADIDSSFGTVTAPQSKGMNNPRIRIVGDNNFGTIRIVDDLK